MRGYKVVVWGLLLFAGFVTFAEQPEVHVDPVVRQILAEVSKIKAQDPAAVPMAFWDLDGTVICGDSGFGLIEDERVLRYRGLIEELILGGMNSIYRGEEGYQRWQKDYQYMTSIGPWLAQSFNAQMYAGVEESKLDAFCREIIQKQRLENWYFSSSIAIWKALADAGVENCIVSANAEALIRNLAPTLGIPRERIRGVRVVSEGGRWTTKLCYPIPNDEGKTEAVRAMVLARPHGVAVAAFGNSYATDGHFLRYVATQAFLPGGAKGTAVMINGGHPRPGFSEHFICVQQRQVVGSSGKLFGGKTRPMPRWALKERINAGIEVYGIVHWGLNTFTDREWGYGDEDPQLLNPDAFDANQIVEACKAGGLQGLIIVAKHHDGFCLWPTKTTEHNITKSPFRKGKGNYVKEMEQACRKYGLKFGVYVSPWDRNHAAYGSEQYVKDVFQAQIRELLSGDYGEVFEMWFDGANGGDGYYGGARERRKIPNDYYRYETETFAMVRKLQPKICIFNEGDGADYRWPGNERGSLSDDSSATIRSYNPKMYHLCSNSGDLKTGATFHPPECDFPLRRGWFYHVSETNTVRCGEYLMQRYLNTVGNGGTMNIGIAPDRHGRLAPEDVAALKRFGELKKEFFARTGDEQGRCNIIVLSEDVSNGELVDSWKVTANGKTIASGTALGIKRIRVLPQPIVKNDIKPVDTHLGEGGLPDGFAIRQMFYYVNPKTLNRVMNATTTNGETDTAQWMTKTVVKGKD